MNRQDWISEWIAEVKTDSIDPTFVDRVMTGVAKRPRKPILPIAWNSIFPGRIPLFRSKPVLLTTGTVGGFLRIAVFLYVLLFIC